MENLLERLQKGDILVGDGAMGTILIERGLRPGEAPESLNLTRPEVAEEVSRLYLEAGAQIVQTNTFGGSPLKLSFYSLEDRTEEINRNAVLAARSAVDDRAYISASCGPSGRLLKPYGDTEPDDLYRSFRRQMRVLIDAGVDMVCVETMTDLTEATLAVKAAKDVSSSIPVAATMTFEATPRGFYTVMGVSVAEAAEGLECAGADIIGSNCGNGIENMIRIARELKEQTESLLMIQSNAGIPQFLGNRPVYPETPEFMAERAKELVSIGVSIIGGCCGTTPAHIREIRQAVDSVRQKSDN
ncbi:hypothetical protein AMJ40_04295 [candidate division TA06 bacterium DG_26]|uniref:Hcy-binding domain-containing protein n=1 Tax=candidate division TA06 bacterium DG_26 TaxID=1703771 RepID=A0A0S7WIH3_UNCT6|nr:MAG: hypothetical protein AMJ40_04295 [candidate division TA06 bacterium DG_26]